MGGTKRCKKEEVDVVVKKEIEDISSDTPGEVELETNDEFLNKNVQEEEIIKPKALIKKSKRRSGQNQPLEEICNNDSDFKIRHRGLCATLQKMRSGKTMQIDVEEQ